MEITQAEANMNAECSLCHKMNVVRFCDVKDGTLCQYCGKPLAFSDIQKKSAAICEMLAHCIDPNVKT